MDASNDMPDAERDEFRSWINNKVIAELIDRKSSLITPVMESLSKSQWVYLRDLIMKKMLDKDMTVETYITGLPDVDLRNIFRSFADFGKEDASPLHVVELGDIIAFMISFLNLEDYQIFLLQADKDKALIQEVENHIPALLQIIYDECMRRGGSQEIVEYTMFPVIDQKPEEAKNKSKKRPKKTL